MKRYVPTLLLSLGLFGSLSVMQLTRQEEPKPVTLAEFYKRTGNMDKTVLVYFHANWCRVCLKMQPLMQKTDSLYKSRIDILSIDTDRDKEVAEEFEVNSLPLFKVYKRGICQWTYVGLIGEKDLFDKLNLYTTPGN